MEQYHHQTTDLFLEAPIAYAGFWERLGASILDGLILFIPNLVLQYFAGTMGIVLSCALPWLYAALMESGESQATIGKKALGLKVTTAEGGRISFGQATGRYFGKFLSTLILFVGYLMMIWDDRKQTLHDKMANTLVVKA